MSQHDYVLADAAGAAFRADLNNALAAIATRNSDTSAPGTTYAGMLWLDTTANLIKRRNAADSGWIVEGTLDEAFVLSRSSNTILAGKDRDKVLLATGSYTQTLTAAATLGDGWAIDVIVDSGVTLVLDPNASETIDGATTKSIIGPKQGRIICNGTLFRTLGFVDTTEAQGADIASASTINLDTATGNAVRITGSTSITAVTLSNGVVREVVFTANGGSVTHGASLKCPDGQNFTWRAGDRGIFVALQSIVYFFAQRDERPAVSAYRNAAQSISAATFTKVNLDTEVLDAGGYFDNATNYRWTPPAGLYLVSFQTTTAGGGTGNLWLALLYKNGAAIARHDAAMTTGLFASAGGSKLVRMNGTDYLELYCYNGSGGSISLAVGNEIGNYLTGVKVGE